MRFVVGLELSGTLFLSTGNVLPFVNMVHHCTKHPSLAVQ